ncbi:MAG: hypothetical protein AAF329_12800 [Cyanobacteria bacterium P01_A01_bin.17]
MAAEERYKASRLLLYPKSQGKTRRQQSLNLVTERVAASVYDMGEQKAVERFLLAVLAVAYFDLHTNRHFDIRHECTSVARLWVPWKSYKPHLGYVEECVRPARMLFVDDIVGLRAEMREKGDDGCRTLQVIEAELRAKAAQQQTKNIQSNSEEIGVNFNG